ncbi:MAG: permease [Erysipelotrichaceae bacterium]
MLTYILYTLSVLGLIISYCKSKEKTRSALKKSWKSFENILPSFLSVILIIGIMLSILTTETISQILGSESGVLGVFIASIVGAITLIPGFVAFPLAAALFDNGAGVAQIAAFVSSLMMVGVITFPLEMKTFGKKATIARNLSAFIFSIVVAFIMGVLL